jgi:6-phosphofructo-2-kinase
VKIRKRIVLLEGKGYPAVILTLNVAVQSQRRKLTKNSTRLVIVLVGLPARGKSFVARKLLNFLEWYGCDCKIFNVGKYRRQAYAETSQSSSSGACDANFFDTKNKEAAALREKVAEIALVDMLKWLDNEEADVDDDRSFSSGMLPQEKTDRIAIFDATNSTDKRRRWILDMCSSPARRPGKPTGCIFVESICDDQELIMENFRFKVSNSPDYKGVDEAEALADLQNRVAKYEEAYETIKDDSLSYIKIFNLSTKLLVNHIYGRMSKVIVPALMAWNIGTRPIFLCRPGQTISDASTDSDDYLSSKVNLSDGAVLNMSAHTRKRLLRGDRLGPTGKRFSDALYDFLFEEGMDFLLKRSSVMDMAATGTSISGLATFNQSLDTDSRRPPFPIKIFTSTMPRAVETVRWDEYDFKIDEQSNLNPLDKGDFAGKELEEIQETNPTWYHKLEQNPFSTR